MRKLSLAILAGVGSALSVTAPVQAQVPAEALDCIIKDMPPELHSALLKLAGDPANDAERRAVNVRGRACSAQYGWTVKKAGEALSYAGFHLRANAERDKLIARNVSPATITDLENAATLFYTNNVQRNDREPFNRWIRGKGWQNIAAFQQTIYFPFFDAYAGAKVAALRFDQTE